MSRFPIPAAAVQTGGLLQGLTFTGFWQLPDTPPSGGPNLVNRWDLNAIYIPVSVTASVSAATVCHLALQMHISGELAWQQQQDVNLAPLGGGWSGGNAIYAESLVNAIAMRNGQRFQLGYIAQLDQAAAALNLFIAAILNNPASGTPQLSPASIGYTETEDRMVLTA